MATWAAFTSPDSSPVLSSAETVRYQDTDHAWQSLKGDIVVVHWYQGSDAFAKKALQIGDDAIRSTSQLLGVTETTPIDFFIYADEASFRTALGPGTRENVGGQAHSDIRTLFALITPDTINDAWVGIVIPHELVHLVFDTAVHNPYRFPPRWFNEGLAVYLSEGYTPSDRNLVQDAVRNAELLPLSALTGQFPTESDKTYLAYAESVSAIDDLVRTHGQDALLSLVAAYKDGLTDDEAFSKALGVDFTTFQAAWLADIGASAPEQYGPVPDPAGPLPPGWDAPAVAGAPGATPAPGIPQPTPVASAGSPAAGGDTGSGAGGDIGLVLGVIAAVVVVVVVGLLVARRRTAGP